STRRTQWRSWITRSSLQPQHLLPFFISFLADLVGEKTSLRVLILPVIGLTRIDHGDGVRKISLRPGLRRNAGIEWCAPSLRDHVDGCCRVTAGRQRP